MSEPASQPTDREHAFILRHRVARMATSDQHACPHVIPICYAYEDQRFFTAIDHKPKRRPGAKLQRVRNIEHNPQVAIVIDDYHDDWDQLAYLIVRGQAQILTSGPDYHRALELLSAKYPQYQRASLATLALPVIQISIVSLTSWGAV